MRLPIFLLLISLTVCAHGGAPEAVTFTNGEISLSGALVRPDHQTNHPGVVFVHGSGPHTREGALTYAKTFTDAGIGVLAFDKRGSGESTGSWTEASLQDLKSDVAAAVAFLRTRPGFDPERIGLWGVSQAGWIIPLVIAEDPKIAFAIVVSGGGASPLQSELYSYDQAFRAAGLAPEFSAEAFAVLGKYFRFLGTGEGRHELLDRIDQTQHQPWTRHANLARITPSEEFQPQWAWVATFDPLLSIATMNCPVLLIFGDADRQQPTTLALERWRQGLALAGNANVTVRVFAGADHGIRLPAASGDHHRGPLASGYLQTISEWLGSLTSDH